MISCLIVNFNCLEYTKKLITDILNQSYIPEEIIIVDQDSIEQGTDEYLELLSRNSRFNVIKNNYNKPLNKIWNEFILMSKYEYCSFLNNDITIPPNFIKDNLYIFNSEPSVSCIIHPTNHPKWTIYDESITTYNILEQKTRQGWDFSFRKSDWVAIPEILDFYCGDDFIFENIYHNNKKVAMATSSPIIHWLSQTRQSKYNKVIPNRNPNKDIENYKKLGFNHYLNILPEYSNVSPVISKINSKK